jgi:formylmethanofuran--tetrahydromethanopterin N-formyltransferase
LQKGIGGGNFLILASSADAALAAAEAGVNAISGVPGVILPFPGGVARSGSKVGARRVKGMIASTNDPFCPTLRVVTTTALPETVNSVLEIVVDGTDADAMSRALRLGIEAACGDGVVAISAGNFGGKLGPHHFYLRRILSAEASIS